MQLSDGRIVWTVMLFVEDPETRKWGAVGHMAKAFFAVK